MDYRRISAQLVRELRQARVAIQDTSERLEELQSFVDAVTYLKPINTTMEKEKAKALVTRGEFYYVGPNKELTRVPTEELTSVIKRMKFKQVEHYCQVCKEPSAALVENREYDLDGEELPYQSKTIEITIRDERDESKILETYECEMPGAFQEKAQDEEASLDEQL